MAGKLLRKIWDVLNTEIELSASGMVTGGVEAAKAVLELAKALNENKSAKELKPFIENIDSLLDVLNSPLVKVAGSALPFVPIATSILTYIVEQTRSEPTLEDSVQLVSQVAYLESVRQFLKDHPEIELAEIPASENVAKQIKQLGELEFNNQDARDTLISFHNSPLAKACNPILVKRLQESGLTERAAKTITERVSRNTHRYMKEAVAEVRDSAKRLGAIYGDGWLRDLEAYNSIDKYLQDVIADKPKETVFNREFTFRDIYVPLEVKPVKSDGEINQNAEPQNIEEWAKEILLDERKKGQFLFLQGGPGRGKSVFCRMFSDWVRQELHPIYTPILIRLRDIQTFDANIDKTLGTAIGWDFVTTDSGWLTDRNTRFLFLLDGFDELLLERGVSNDLKLFLEQVAQFQRRAAENSERGHRVLITGRPLALYGIERLMPTNLERVEIIPMDETIQQKWLEKWQAVVDYDPNVAAEKVQDCWQFLQNERCPEAVKNLAKEPLILYLLAVMHRDQQLTLEMFETTNAGEAKVIVYQQALELVLNEQRSQQGYNLNNQIMEADDLRSLLAEAGLCVVQSGREFASIKMIEDRLLEKEDSGAIEVIETARKAGSDQGLKNALAAFYLKSGVVDNSVEFFHKSFGEFLCAEHMAETMEEWTQKIKKGRKVNYVVSTKELEWQVYDLFGSGNLTVEIVEYLMALLVQNQIDFVVLFQRLHEFYLQWSDGEFIEATEDTIPQKKARQLQQHEIERGQRQVDIYAGLNVLILLFELRRYGQLHDKLKEELHFYPSGEPDSDEFDRQRLLQIIGYSQCLKVNAFLESVGQFLSDAHLSRAHLIGAHLIGAHLIGAHLIGAHLIDAILIGAILIGAILIGAILIGAILIGAHLIDAILSGAILSGAHLSDANLSGANLSGAHLSGIRWNNETQWSNVVRLHEATRVPEDLQQQPEFAAVVVLSRGYSQVEEGKVEEAIADYNEAQTLNRQLEISARFWHRLCWFGSLHNHAEAVLFAGEKAVELEPDNPDYRDTRGLARALTGNITGAIEDFQAVLDSQFFDNREEEKQQRQRWLEALKAGDNPFTPEELEALRH